MNLKRIKCLQNSGLKCDEEELLYIKLLLLNIYEGDTAEMEKSLSPCLTSFFLLRLLLKEIKKFNQLTLKKIRFFFKKI